MKKLTIKESTEPIKESSNGPRYVTRDIVNKTNSQKLKDAYDKGELEVLINGDIWYTERCPNGLGKELKAEMKRLYPNIKHLYGESSNKSVNSSILSPNRLVQWAVGILFDMNKFVADVEDNEYWLTYGVGDGEFEETTTDKAKNNYKEHEWLVTDVDTHEFDVEAFNDFLNAFKSATSNKSDYNQEERQRIIDAAEGLLSAVDEEYSLDESIKESYSKSYTRKMLEYSDLLDEQGLRDLVLTFVKWMGDDEIGDLARANDLVSVFEESKQSTGDKLSINEEIALFNDDSADFTVDQQIDLYLMELQSMLETINSMFNKGKLYERPLLDALKKCYDIIDNTPEK